MPELKAERIVAAVNKMRQELWPLWQRERALVAFYNSGPLPTDCNEASDDEVQCSLGLGYRYIKKPLESLLDVMLTDPGFIKSELCYPLRADRQGLVETAVDREINKIVHNRMESSIRSACGRALITGRAIFFRLSRWDWRFRPGRLICPIDATDDIHDESFREWAFSGQLTLRQIDELIGASSRYDNNGGWRNSSLSALKEYILETTCAEKDPGLRAAWVRESMGRPFGDDLSNSPLEVYWYFRKNGEHGEDGKEKVDLFCISRWNMTSTVATVPGEDGVLYKSLSQAGSTEKQQIIYKLENAFESVEECLIPMILDARIDGEQEMAQVDGVGRIMTPRLQSMEHITTALLEGIAWGIQPNWTSNAPGAVPPEVLRALQKAGLGPWDFIPNGLTVVNKQNSMQGLNQALQFLQVLGMSSEADAQTGEIAPNGQSPAKFKAEALMYLQQLGTGLQRRAERAADCWDRVSEQIGETFTRMFSLWRKADAAYYDVRQFQSQLFFYHKILPAEYSSERIKFKCRRLAGGMDKQTLVQAGTQFMQFWGPMMSPAGQRSLAKEVARAQWGDPRAEVMYPEQPPENKPAQQDASDQNSKAFVDLVMPARDDHDNPAIHLPVHAAALEKRIALAETAGTISHIEREGMSLLLLHMAEDAKALPPGLREQVGQKLQETAMRIQKLKVGEGQDTELKVRAQLLKEAQFGFSQQREQNLVQDRGMKHQLNRDKFMLDVQRLLEDRSKNAVEKAKTLYEMMQPAETAALPETAESSQPA